jgi:murein DD-endopeptidase MepM/ murein hydrolase activator NlpD
MTAIFGGIFGLATVTSIIALLIQAVPPRDDRALAAGAGSAPSPSGEAKAPVQPVSKKRKREAIPGPWRLSELEKDASVTIASAAMDRRSFIVALGEKNVPKAEVYRILKAFDGVRAFDKSGRKDRFSVAMNRTTKHVVAFEYEVDPSEVYQAREGDGGLLTGTKLDMKIAEAEVTAAFYVGKDLHQSYEFAGLEDGILDALDEALRGRISSESFEEGSIVKLVAVEETALGLFARYKSISAVEYRPADPAAKTIRVYAFKGDKSRGNFDDRGMQFGGGWRKPCVGCPITSHFNPKRKHPILHKIMPHNGTDFGAPTGTPLYAAFRGTITWVGPHGPTGNFVEILHPNGVSTGYAHLSRFAPGLKKGDKVGTHQLVGYVGTTGRSTGPHLHLSAKRDGKFFDILTLDLDGEHPMASADRPAFQAYKAELDKRLEAIALPEPPPEAPPPEAPSPATEGSSAALPAAEAAAPTPDRAPSVGASPARRAAPVPTNVPLEDGGIRPGSLIEDSSEDDGE